MSTIKDVARLAGVAPSTVSAIINGRIQVKPETHGRVLSAIEKLQYRPNSVARGLRLKETHSIGLIVPFISNLYYGVLAQGAEDYLNTLGYNLFICNSHRDQHKEAQYINALRDKCVDAILMATFAEDSNNIHLLENSGIAIVVNQKTDISFVDEVYIDFVESCEEMVTYLLEQGHRKIALINGSPGFRRCKDRLEGYRRAFAKKGLLPDDSLHVYADFTPESAYDAAVQLFQRQDRPTCIFTTEHMALGVLNAAYDCGVDIPTDVSLAGFANTRDVRPRMTTVYQPSYSMGKQMAEIAIARKNATLPLEKQSVQMETHIIIQDSVIKI